MEKKENFFTKLGSKIKFFFAHLFKPIDKDNPSYMYKFIKNNGVQSAITSLVCAIIGLFIGFIILLIINPEHAGEGIKTILLNFFVSTRKATRIKNFGITLAKTVPLILTGLSVLFCYKTGLFNIGAAGQYTIGIAACLVAACDWHLPWYLCILVAAIAGAIWGGIVGLLKAFLNVNEVISAIMLNWIGLYLTNIILKSSQAFDQSKNETFRVASINPSAIIPDLGLQGANAFGPNSYVTLAIIIVPIICILIFLFLRHSTFGYELKATGINKDAARYAGMKEKRNIIITMAIGGAIAAMAAPFYYLTNIEQYFYPTSVPSMGFNGISSAFLGGLDPIGVIFSSYFLTHITEGGARIDTRFYSTEISSLVSSMIIYLCAFVFFMKYILNKILQKRKEEKRIKEETSIRKLEDDKTSIKEEVNNG